MLVTDFFNETKLLINRGEISCAVTDGEKILFSAKGAGILPLYGIYKEHKAEMKGLYVFDKAAGIGAATLLADAGVKYVYAAILSEGAAAILIENGALYSYKERVPYILNRRQDGKCMLEESLTGIAEQAERLTAIDKFVQRITEKR